MSNKLVDLSALKFDDAQLIPAIIQSHETKRVLMMAWMSLESLEMSIRLGTTVFYSRSRSEIWRKGETSGNTQIIKTIEVDCDADCLLISVIEQGPACHTNLDSCFDSGEIATVGLSDG